MEDREALDSAHAPGRLSRRALPGQALAVGLGSAAVGSSPRPDVTLASGNADVPTDHGGTLIPCFRDWLDVRHREVGGHTLPSGFDMDNDRIAEKAFLKA